MKNTESNKECRLKAKQRSIKWYYANKERKAKYDKIYNEKHKERKSLQRKERYAKNVGSEKIKQHSYNRSIKAKFLCGIRTAKTRNLNWLITFEEYKLLIENALCFYCTGELTGTGYNLDRIDNKSDYNLKNVLPCCGSCNLIRGNYLTSCEMKIAMNAVVEYRKTTK